jgi:hypothetical protein
MLRLNLSTRPFYNERGVHVALAVMALVLLVVTVFNAREILALSARHTAMRTQVDADRARAQDSRQRASRLRAELRQDELEQVLAETREANALIDQRTFSWTELFNHLEATLPADVMLRSVQPQVKEGRLVVTLGVIGRRVDDIDAFMERLEETGAFSGLLAETESPEEDGSLRASLVGFYDTTKPAPATAPVADAAPAASAGQEARR